MPDREHIITRKLTRNYVIALGFIAVLSIAIFFMLLEILSANENMAAVINISGRQRMLSQRVALYGLRLVRSETEAERQNNRTELLATADTLETIYKQLLVSGGSYEGRNLPPPSEEVISIYFGPRGQLDAQISSQITEARQLASEPDELLNPANPHLQAVLNAAETGITEGLNEVVSQYERESESTSGLLETLLAASVAVILISLVLEGLFIFRPIVGRIRKEAQQLEEAYQQQRRIASTLQKNLVSGEIPEIRGLQIGLYYKSATSTAEVGGDFYDFVSLPDGGWGIEMGDVAGKGIDAAVEPVRVRELMNDRALRGLPPSGILESVNDTLVRQHTEMFIAMTYFRYHPDEPVLKLANCGNPYPFLISSKRFVEVSEPPLAAAEGSKYTTFDVPFEPGEIMLLYTDGLAQAKTGHESYFGQELDRHVAGKEDIGPQRLVESLAEEAASLAGGELQDDILVMAVRRLA